jgi:hypothetical protein
VQAKVSGQVARRHAQLSFWHLSAESAAKDDGDQFRNWRARLLTRQPPQNRRVVAPYVRHTSGRSHVNYPAR